MNFRCGIRTSFRKFHSARSYYFNLRGSDLICGPNLKQRRINVGATLWRYFNAPGNAIFITTNIVTLGGMMLYSTLSTFYRQSTLINSLENGFPVEDRLEEISNTKHDPLRINALEKHGNLSSSFERLSSLESSVYPGGTVASKDLEEISTSTSYFAKMTLFYLFYSFHVYKASLQDISTVNNEILMSLIEKLPKMRFDDMRVECYDFYGVWKQEFSELISGLNKSQQFHLPKPSSFPEELQDTFKLLEENPMETHRNFYNFYHSVANAEQKQLLQQWYYDNCSKLKKMNNFSNEKIYINMIQDSSKWNERVFEKYLKLVFRPNSYRSRAMFNTYYINGFSSISLSTSLEILKGLLTSDLELKNDYVVQIVSLLRKNSIMASQEKVRILLPSQKKAEQMNELMTPDVKKKTFSVMAQDPVALKLLSSIGQFDH